jgi:flagellar basal body-associated protein FliL
VRDTIAVAYFIALAIFIVITLAAYLIASWLFFSLKEHSAAIINKHF